MSTNDWSTSYYSPAPTAPPSWPGQYQPPAPYQTWAPQPPRRGSGWGVGLVFVTVFLGLAVLAGTVFGMSALRDHTGKVFHAPERIGRYPLMTSPEALQGAQDALGPVKNLHRAVSGLYGTGSRPTLVLIAGDADDTSSRVALDNAKAEGKDSGQAFGASRTFGDITCAPMTAPLRGTMCFWAGKTSDGALLHVGATNLGAVAKETAEARAAVEA